MKRSGSVLLFMGAVASGACGGGQAVDSAPAAQAAPSQSAVRSEFPSRERLEAIFTSVTPTERADETRIATVSAWEMVGELPVNRGRTPLQTDGPVATLVEALVAANPQAVPTEQLSCFVHQTQAFELMHGADMPPDITRFVSQRCGLSSTPLGDLTYEVELSDQYEDEEDLIEEVASDVQSLTEMLGDGPVYFGISTYTSEDKIRLTMSVGNEVSTIEPSPIVASGSEIRIRGTLNVPARRLSASITKGKVGTADCQTDESQLPNWEVICPLEPGDDWASIGITHFAGSALLGETATVVGVASPGQEVRSFSRISVADIPTSGDTATDLVAIANEVRKTANLKPIAVSSAQQAVVERALSPYVDASIYNRDLQTLSQISFGLMAGWDVEGRVERGTIAWQVLAPTSDSGRAEADCFDVAQVREALLAPEVDVVSIAATTLPGGRRVALIVAFELLDDAAIAETNTAVTEAFNQIRADQNLPRIRSINREVRALVEATARSASETGTVPDLNVLVQKAAESAERSLGADAAAGFSIDDLLPPDPNQLLGSAEMDFAVVPFRPVGEAWWRKLIVTVFAAP